MCTVHKVGGGGPSLIQGRAAKAVVTTVVALGALAYLARTWGLPYLLKRQGYFESTLEGALVKYFTRLSRQKMDSFDGDLPPLTPPPLDQSLERLKKEGEVLLEGEVLEGFLAQVDYFRKVEGPPLHQKLLETSKGLGNYIQDIWERKAYLEGRSLLGSNWFGLSTPPPPHMEGGDPQLIRATYMIEGAIQFLTKIRKRELAPFFLGIPIPVSMRQFDTLFGMCRIPQEGCDRLQKSTAREDYFAVLCRGNYYTVPLHQSREALFASLSAIREDRSPTHLEIGFFTAGDREVWAKKREELMEDPEMATSLALIEGAQFLLCLDEEATGGLEGMSSKALLQMQNRHFDMGMQWIVDRDGRCATNNEHTGAESTAQAQMLGEILAWEKAQLKEGKLQAPHPSSPGVFTACPFKHTDELHQALADVKAAVEAQAQAYSVSTFETAFGKSVLKEKRVSPDAFMQMSNLLAFYQLTGELSAVYETAMMRFFRGGRTETIGTLTHAAKELVLAVGKGVATGSMLKTALSQHKQATLDAMRNRGHERHLLALKVVAKEIPLLFKDPGYLALQRKRISSSQTPTDTGGGGFLPTEEDGVGISYIPRDSHFLMTVTTKRLDIEGFKVAHAKAMKTLLNLL